MFFSFEGVFIIKLELSVLQGNLLTTLIFKNFKPLKENSLDTVAYICNSNTGWGWGEVEGGQSQHESESKASKICIQTPFGGEGLVGVLYKAGKD